MIIVIIGIETVLDGRLNIVTFIQGLLTKVTQTVITTECKFVKLHPGALTQTVPGDNVRLSMKSISVKDINRRFVYEDSKQDPPQEAETFQAQVIMKQLPENNQNGFAPVFDFRLSHIACKIR